MKHDLVAISVDRPEPAGSHLALGFSSGLDRGLVHGQHAALEHVCVLRLEDRLKQIDGPARPGIQARTAHHDAVVAQALMLTVQRQVVAELVDQHPGQEAHLGRGPLQHLPRRRGGHDRQGVLALHHRSHVLEHDMAARLLSEAIAHLLADDLAQILRNRLDGRVFDLDGLDRHAGVESKTAVVDRAIAHFVPALIGDGLRRGLIKYRRRFDAQAGEQVALLDRVKIQAFL